MASSFVGCNIFIAVRVRATEEQSEAATEAIILSANIFSAFLVASLLRLRRRRIWSRGPPPPPSRRRRVEWSGWQAIFDALAVAARKAASGVGHGVAATAAAAEISLT